MRRRYLDATTGSDGADRLPNLGPHDRWGGGGAASTGRRGGPERTAHPDSRCHPRAVRGWTEGGPGVLAAARGRTGGDPRWEDRVRDGERDAVPPPHVRAPAFVNRHAGDEGEAPSGAEVGRRE